MRAERFHSIRAPTISTPIFGDLVSLDGCNIERTYINEVPGNCCCGCHDWADKVRAAVLALAAFEIAIGGTRAALVRWQDVGVHADAHAAPGVAPFKTRLAEYFVEPLFFSLRFDAARTRHNQSLLDAVRHMLAGHKMRRGSQIIEARIRA